MQFMLHTTNFRKKRAIELRNVGLSIAHVMLSLSRENMARSRFARASYYLVPREPGMLMLINLKCYERKHLVLLLNKRSSSEGEIRRSLLSGAHKSSRCT